MKRVSIFLVMMLTAVSVFGTDYYVDNTGGNDNNSGTSPSQAWRSVYKVNISTFSPGDNIYFKRGGIWRDQLKANYAGSAGAPITYGAYGSGDKPVISAAQLRSGWAQYSGSVWSLSTGSTKQVFFDGVRGEEKSSLSELATERDWYWENDMLYVFSNTNPDAAYQSPGIEVSVKFYAVYTVESHVTFQDLEIGMAEGDGLLVTNGADHVTISNLSSSNNYWTGIKISDGGAVSDGCSVQNNTVQHNAGSGIAFANIANTTISQNTVSLNCQLDTGEEQHNWDAGIKFNGTSTISNIIEHNTVSESVHGAGIWLDFCGKDNIIRYNHIYGNEDNGIYNEITSGSQIYYNLVHDNTGTSIVAGIWISGRDGEAPYGGDADSNVVVNNICYGNGAFGILLHNDDGVAGNTEHNIIQNNVVVNTLNGPNLRVGGGAENSPNTIEYNSFGDESSNFIEWGWGGYLSSYDAFEAAYGASTNSLEETPDFIDPLNGDFHLSPSSTAIDAGTIPAITLAMDFDGNPVPQGTSFDIGIYESAQSTPPMISVSSVELTFSATEGDQNPSAQSIRVNNSGDGSLSWTAVENPEAAWMLLSNANGGDGDEVSVSLDISGLDAGTYQTSVRISDPGASNSPVDVPVTLNVEAGQSSSSVLAEVQAEDSPSLPIWDAWVDLYNDNESCIKAVANSTRSPRDEYRLDYQFDVPQGVETVYVFAEVDVNASNGDDSFWVGMNGEDECKWNGMKNLGDGWKRAWVYHQNVDDQHAFDVSVGQNVLNLYPRENGSFMNWMVVTTDPDFDIENYAFGSGGTDTTQAPNPPVISIAPEALNFVATEGDQNPAAQAVTVSNSGEGTLTWAALESPDAGWLLLTNTSGGAGDAVTASIDISGLAAGTYETDIRISDPEASNSPVDVPVTLTVQAAQSGSDILAEVEAEESESLPLWDAWVEVWEGGEPCLKTVANSTSAPNDDYRLDYQFTVPQGVGTVYVFAEVDVNGSGDDDSFWIGMNGDDVCKWNGLSTIGDGWKRAWVYHQNVDTQHAFAVSAGENVLNVYARENGSFLNWLVVTTDPNFDIESYEYGIGGTQQSAGESAELSSQGEMDMLPKEFKLHQNYPNPFNPLTTIQFNMVTSGHVEMLVYNMLGKQVAVLLDEGMDAGYHSINYNASDLPSGIYLYQIRVRSEQGSYVMSKKMILSK